MGLVGLLSCVGNIAVLFLICKSVEWPKSLSVEKQKREAGKLATYLNKQQAYQGAALTGWSVVMHTEDRGTCSFG